MNQIFHHRRAVLSGGARLVLSAALMFQSSWAGSAVPEARLQAVSFENDQLRIQLDRETRYKVFPLSAPPRLVVELYDTLHGRAPSETSVDGGLLKRIRSAQFTHSPKKVTRVVLDMLRQAPYEASREGSSILLRFSGAEAVESLSGAAEASVTAGAAQGAPLRKSKRRGKDLLSALPRQPVTIDFENADIRDVIRVLSEMSDINMIHGGDVSGFLTIHLDQVPFNQAFDTILAMQGLVAQQMGDNILRILTPASLSADRSRAVTTYKTFVLNYANASDVQQHISSVRISPNGKITVDERTNSIVVTDTPEGLSAAERLIAELDQKPEQVLIESKLVEIALDDRLDLGIQWEYSNINRDGPAGYNRKIIGQREVEATTTLDIGEVGFPTGFVDPVTGGVTNIVESAFSPSPGPTRGTGVNLPGNSATALTFGMINNTDILTATLNALVSKSATKVLSSPRVITLNNRQARIQVGDRIPYSTTTVGAGGVSQESVTFVDVGIILNVTPTINANERIRLNVKPEVSSVKGVSIPGAPPQITTRTAETEVLIRDGETLVIGGLIDDQTIETERKVPLLGDIPVLGVFFRSTGDQKIRKELLIFLTPSIVHD
ncbi:MAG: type IV pilus secretin PilQ [Elusimicrobiota bacterium]